MLTVNVVWLKESHCTFSHRHATHFRTAQRSVNVPTRSVTPHYEANKLFRIQLKLQRLLVIMWVYEGVPRMIWMTAVDASPFSTYCCCLHFLPASTTVSHLRNTEIRENKMATSRDLTTKARAT